MNNIITLKYILSGSFIPVSDLILKNLSILDLYNLYFALLYKNENNDIVKNCEIIRKIKLKIVFFDKYCHNNVLSLKDCLFSSDIYLVCYSLLKGYNINSIDSDGNNALLYNTNIGYLDFNINYDIIKLLIRFGADVNWQNDKKESPLIKSVLSSNLIIIKLLLENDANVNIQNYNGETPLMLISGIGQYNDNHILNILINYGANINERNYKGRTALMYASINHFYQNIKILLKNGADVRIKDDLNLTALCYAQNYLIEHVNNTYRDLRSLFYPCTYLCRMYNINYDSPFSLRNKLITIKILENYKIYI